MLTDAQVYCMTSMIYLFRPPLTAKAIYRKTAEAKLYTYTAFNKEQRSYLESFKNSMQCCSTLTVINMQVSCIYIFYTNKFDRDCLNYLS